MLHGLCCGEEAGARNLVFFRVQWLQPAMKGTSSVRRVRLRSFLSRIVPPMCFATSGCSCVRSSIVFCNSVSADRMVVAASRLLGAAAACVILLSFAAEDRKSYWNGCIKAAKVICQQIFLILALIFFLLKFLYEVLQNRLFVALASRSGFGAAISDAFVQALYTTK